MATQHERAEAHAKARQQFDAKLGEIPAGGGSTPDPADPATTDPLGHLDDLPGVSEEAPTPGEGWPDTAPIDPPPEPPPPPAARSGGNQRTKGE